MPDQETATTEVFEGISRYFSTRMLIALGCVAAALIIALIIHWIVYRVGFKAAKRSKSRLLERILNRTRAISRIGIMILAIEFTLPLVDMPDSVRTVLDRIVLVTLIGVCGWLVNQLLRSVTDARIARFDLNNEANMDARKVATRMKVLRQGMGMIILLVTIGAMLMTFPDVRAIGVSMFASAGVAGIVIGFAAQPVLSNLLAGIQIALTQPIRIGDAVIMEGEWGWIEEINSTFVVVKIWDWRRLVVPLTQIINKPIQNWSLESQSIIGSVTFFLDYTAPVSDMREKLKEFLKESKHWDGDVQVLQVIDTTLESVQVRALMSAHNSPTAWDLRCEIREKMIGWLQKEHPSALPRRRGEIRIDESDVSFTPTSSAKKGADESGMSDQIKHPEDDPDIASAS